MIYENWLNRGECYLQLSLCHKSVRCVSSYLPFSDRCKEGVNHDCHESVTVSVSSEAGGKELRVDGTRHLPVTTSTDCHAQVGR